MVDSKKINKIIKHLIFAYILLFPFGPFIRISFSSIRIHPTDIVVIFIAILSILQGDIFKKLSFFKIFILYILFSYISALFVFNFTNIYGGLYLIRFVSYLIFFEKVYRLSKESIISNEYLYRGLTYISTIVVASGLVQYLLFPDLRYLNEFGWDDHYGRLAGFFLDPGFAGIMLTLVSLLLIYRYFSRSYKSLLLFISLSIIGIWLTFSRAAYLSFIIGMIFLLRSKLDKKLIVGLVLGFLVIIPFLPQFSSEGTNLLRTYSIFARLDSYDSTTEIFKRSPLLGIGFNNLCEYKITQLNDSSYYSHACSGSDSSLILLIATTGLAGVITFFYSLRKMYISRDSGYFRSFLAASFISLLAHSLFTNSLFYPWVLGWFALIYAIDPGVKEKN